MKVYENSRQSIGCQCCRTWPAARQKNHHAATYGAAGLGQPKNDTQILLPYSISLKSNPTNKPQNKHHAITMAWATAANDASSALTVHSLCLIIRCTDWGALLWRMKPVRHGALNQQSINCLHFKRPKPDQAALLRHSSLVGKLKPSSVWSLWRSTWISQGARLLLRPRLTWLDWSTV